MVGLKSSISFHQIPFLDIWDVYLHILRMANSKVKISSWYAGLVMLRAGQDTGMIHAAMLVYGPRPSRRLNDPPLGPIDLTLLCLGNA